MLFFGKPAIKWHQIDRTAVQEARNTGLEEFQFLLSELANDPNLLSSVSIAALEHSCSLLLLGDASDRVIEEIKISHYFRAKHFQSLISPATVTFSLPGKGNLPIASPGINMDVTFSALINGIHLARILRCTESTEIFRAIPFGPIIGLWGYRMNEAWEDYLKFEQTLHHDPQEASRLLRGAMRKLQAESMNSVSVKTTLSWIGPVFQVWEAIFAGNAKDLNKLLHKALTMHQKEMSERSQSQRDPLSAIHFPALAACCYAHDLGMKITVSSDYIPEFLIRGDFPRVKWPNPEWITA